MSRIDAFEAMLARGQDSEMLRMTLGQAHLDAGDAGRAAEHLERAVAMKPDWSAAWRTLGRARAAGGEHAAALDAFDRGLDAARAAGDKQVEKEIGVFRRRSARALDAASGPPLGTASGAPDDACGDAPDRAADER